MRSASWLSSALAIAAASGACLIGPLANAEELQKPGAPQAAVNVPKSGLSMDKVEATFGAPSRRVPAVGEPPITRWEYPGFTVYFEHQFVIHTVVTTAAAS